MFAAAIPTALSKTNNKIHHADPNKWNNHSCKFKTCNLCLSPAVPLETI